jgi:hypothetical protein
MELEQFVNDVRASEILSCSVQTLRNYRHLGRGPAYTKRGRMVRYKVADLLNYMAAGRIEPEYQEAQAG